MQQVPVFSRPQTVPPASVPAATPQVWILNSWPDLNLYVCTLCQLRTVFRLKPSVPCGELRFADALSARSNFKEAEKHYLAPLGANPELTVG
jgi:hypothetical protein